MTAKKRLIQTACVLVVIAGIAVSGCGVKGAPVAPAIRPASAIDSLTAAVKQDLVILKWHYKGSAKNIDGFAIYRGSEKRDEKNCKDCPVIFQKIKVLKAVDIEKEHKYTDQAPYGFRYMYKVRPVTRFSSQGPDSNIVKVEVIQKKTDRQ
ncbi:MAG: hypothetical protein GY874_19020 [Desulfobacteraceae bacterium]|nr:hypothetical protein [Desulfobacteraceae bacterium]